MVSVIDRRTLFFGGSSVALTGAGAAYLFARDMGHMADFTAASIASRATLPASADISHIIRYATLAANSHNTQPWRFDVHDHSIEIRPDFTRQLSAVDPNNHHLFASLGCAAENLSIAASVNGQPGSLSFDGANKGSVQFVFENRVPQQATLFAAITKRQSTRSLFDGKAVSSADLATLAETAAMSGVDVVLVLERAQINRIRDLVVAGNTAQMADAPFMNELKSWLRFSPRYALEMGDGLFASCSGNPALPEWLGPMMFDMVFKAEAENDKYARHIASSAGIAVFVAAKDDPEHWVLAGRACQRFALAATALGIKHAFLNQPVEVAGLRPELAALVGMPGRRPNIVMRFGYGAELPFSARRPVETVMA